MPGEEQDGGGDGAVREARGGDPRWPRRRVLAAISTVGVGSAVFGRALTALAEGKSEISASMVRDAEWIAGLSLSGDDRKMMLAGVNDSLKDYAKVRAVALDNAIPPAVRFDPEPGVPPSAAGVPPREIALPDKPSGTLPASEEDVAFLPVRQLAPLLRDKKISSTDLTRL